MSQQDINWSILWDTGTCLTCCALTEANDWSIRHPYVATGLLTCICNYPELVLTPLRLARYTCFLPFRLILWPFKLLVRFILYIFGFRREGVAKDSYASRYQSRRYGGYVPRESVFSKFQAQGAADDYEDEDETESTFADPVILMSGIGVYYVLGREWGWWY
ncbi:hypothetical protein DEU56DRAFT_917884 [Suillus clintonianus]|uniref:uncharacterized protein n=1 Tax=Suillus clintonianus TaxID=1904413 RepID=UPI001B86BDFE|nr:uncharacterized protein DEU56DRAFT_917884 [Suillus clintonianus]KAG2122238.1 hypothetical protein DEU56DRAFT_917884 [Suillus clintonianus]